MVVTVVDVEHYRCEWAYDAGDDTMGLENRRVWALRVIYDVDIKLTGQASMEVAPSADTAMNRDIGV